VTGNLLIDPSVVAGVVMSSQVVIVDVNNVTVFNHTFKQAYTINFYNIALASITVTEGTSASYPIDLVYQPYAIGAQDMPLGPAQISYTAVAPFATPKALGTVTAGYVTGSISSLVTGTNSISITMPAGFSGYCMILVSLNNVATFPTFSLPTMDGSGANVTLQLTNTGTTSVNSSPWAIVSWNGGSLAGVHTFGFTSSSNPSVTAVYADVFYSTEACFAVSTYHSGAPTYYSVGSGQIANPFSTASQLGVSYYLGVVNAVSPTSGATQDNILDQNSNAMGANTIFNLSSLGVIRSIYTQAFVINVLSTTTYFKNATVQTSTVSSPATGWCVEIYVVQSITVQP